MSNTQLNGYTIKEMIKFKKNRINMKMKMVHHIGSKSGNNGAKF